MTVLQLVVPVTSSQLHMLEECLQSIKSSTPVDHVVNIAIGRVHLEDRIAEALNIARQVYQRAGLVITCVPPELGYNGIVMEVLRTSDFQYNAILPVSHRIADKEWFGKMQLPHIRAPSCGMTFAPDETEANANASFPANWRVPVPGMFFMLQRNAMNTAKAAPIDLDGLDIATAIRDHLRSVGANCWGVPSCRVQQMHADWA
jgi:hypothetical protein